MDLTTLLGLLLGLSILARHLAAFVSRFRCSFYVSIQIAVCKFLLRLITSTRSPHRYQPLHKAESEIRLFKVQSTATPLGSLFQSIASPLGAVMDFRLIKADLITTPIATAPPFAAVSYRWTVGDTVPILLNNRKFMVSRSIFQLLVSHANQSKIQDEPDTQFLWIDSICINQDDNQERSWQVTMMQDIYRSATHVVGWFGVDTPPITQPDPSNVDRVFEAILRNDFFFRTWIVQEVSLAKRLFMYALHDHWLWDTRDRGRSSQELKVLLDNWLQDDTGSDFLSPHRVRRAGYGFMNLVTLDQFRTSLTANPDGLPLGYLLLLSMEFQCTDPRDRIYGILGLATATARSTVVVDYSDRCSVVDVTCQAVRFTITQEGFWQPMELSGVGYARSGLEDSKPSWIPDWEAPHTRQTKNQILIHTEQCFGGLPSKDGTLASLVGPGRSLQLEGVIIDKVEHLITAPWNLPETWEPQDEDSLAMFYVFLDQLDMSCELARGDRPCPGKIGDIHGPLLRVLLQKASPLEIAGEANRETQFRELRLILEGLSRDARSRLVEKKGNVQRHDDLTWDILRRHLLTLARLIPMVLGRRLCVTREGSFANVPPFSKVGDVVCKFTGAPNAFVLRSWAPPTPASGDGDDSHGQTYQCVGVCFEEPDAQEDLRRRDLRSEMITLV
ncbi:Heterokaryon incompatibility [Apiospora arundinis]